MAIVCCMYVSFNVLCYGNGTTEDELRKVCSLSSLWDWELGIGIGIGWELGRR